MKENMNKNKGLEIAQIGGERNMTMKYALSLGLRQEYWILWLHYVDEFNSNRHSLGKQPEKLEAGACQCRDS